MGIWDTVRDGETILCGLCWKKDSTGAVDGGECDGVAGLGGHLLWGGSKSPGGPAESLHQEWAFLQRITPDIGMTFQLV